MTTTVNIHEAKTHFSRLIASVAAGDEVIIAKNGKHVARLTAIKDNPPEYQVDLQGKSMA
jgi:prevent-host-death family protein